MFAETFAEFFQHACQSAALLLPFPSLEERRYLDHIIERSRFSVWAFVLAFATPFLISEVIFLKESLEMDDEDVQLLVRFACAMTAIFLACLLPWLRGRKVLLETLWALLLCVFLTVLLTRPVVIVEENGRPPRLLGKATKGSLAELLVVAGFSFLPLRFCVALPVLVLCVIGSASASYISGNMMDPLLLGLLGTLAIYNLALLEGHSRRNFQLDRTVVARAVNNSKGVQASSEDNPTWHRTRSKKREVVSSNTVQDPIPQRRVLSLPTEEANNEESMQKVRSDGHILKVAAAARSREGRTMPRFRAVRSLEQAEFNINVVPDPNAVPDDELLSYHFPSQSTSFSKFRNAQATSPVLGSMTSSDFRFRPNGTPRQRPEGEASRLGTASRHSLSVSKSSDGEDPSSVSSRYQQPLVEVANAQCQTDIIWKDGDWHCTRCSKPPAPRKSVGGPGLPDVRRRSKASKSAVDAWKLGIGALSHLQGTWRLAYGPQNVSPWLEHFAICGTTVCCEDVDRPIEMAEAVHPMLAGGMLLLDKDNMLHRFGKTGQHLMFQRYEVTNLTSLVQRMNEDHDPQWFAQRVPSGEIDLMAGEMLEDLMQLDDERASAVSAASTCRTESWTGHGTAAFAAAMGQS